MFQTAEGIDMADETLMKAESSFLLLPTELRLNIYSYIWAHQKRTMKLVLARDRETGLSELVPSWHGLQPRDSPPLATALKLTQTCTQMAAEVQDIMYAQTKFQITILSFPASPGSPNLCRGFLSYARDVLINITYQPPVLNESGETAMFLEDARAVLDILERSKQLRTFRITLSTIPKWKLSLQEQRIMKEISELEDNPRFRRAEKLADAFMLLGRMEEVLKELLD